jgi:ribosome-binding protein aMBF1 (putative translation factor)
MLANRESEGLVCWNCGASLQGLSLPLLRLDTCKTCKAELHVCRLCVEYHTGYAKHCREPTAEEVRKKTEANFCDHFKPRLGAYFGKDPSEIERTKAALAQFFKK